METRPVIQVQLSRLDKTLESVSMILLVTLWCFTIYALVQSPSIIPLHYNAYGQVDIYGGKWTIVLLPLLGTIIYFGLGLLNRYPHIFNYVQKITPSNAHRQYSIAVRMLRFLKLAILIIVSIITVFDYLNATGVVKGLGVWFLPFTFVIILLPAIVLIIQSLKNDNTLKKA